MRFGYNTNGFAHHWLEDTLAILAELGYRSVALTLDYHVLNPYEPSLPQRCEALRKKLQSLDLGCVIETGARFLLDPRRKHQPTLLCADAGDRNRRLDFLTHAIEVAQRLNAEAVSFWSGTPMGIGSEAVLMDRLVGGCKTLIKQTSPRRVRPAAEPYARILIP